MEAKFDSFEQYINFARSYIGKTIKGYHGIVKAITIYGDDHEDENKISLCFKESDGYWSEESVAKALDLPHVVIGSDKL